MIDFFDMNMIFKQVRHLTSECDVNDIIIDVSPELYSYIAKNYSAIQYTGEETKKMYACDINIIPHTPERYFKVSKKEKAILKYANKQAILFCSVCGLSTYSICYNFCPRCGSRLRGLTAERSDEDDE